MPRCCYIAAARIVIKSVDKSSKLVKTFRTWQSIGFDKRVNNSCPTQGISQSSASKFESQKDLLNLQLQLINLRIRSNEILQKLVSNLTFFHRLEEIREKNPSPNRKVQWNVSGINHGSFKLKFPRFSRSSTADILETNENCNLASISEPNPVVEMEVAYLTLWAENAEFQVSRDYQTVICYRKFLFKRAQSSAI